MLLYYNVGIRALIRKGVLIGSRALNRIITVKVQYKDLWRCGGLMVSALNSRSSGLGLNLGQGHSGVFLGKTLHSVSLHLGV